MYFYLVFYPFVLLFNRKSLFFLKCFINPLKNINLYVYFSYKISRIDEKQLFRTYQWFIMGFRHFFEKNRSNHFSLSATPSHYYPPELPWRAGMIFTLKFFLLISESWKLSNRRYTVKSCGWTKILSSSIISLNRVSNLFPRK